MRILALDAATEACSVALLQGDAMRDRHEILGRGHADRLLPMVQELLVEARLDLCDLDAIAFGRGPGGFTGLRIAAGLVQGLAYGAGLPVLPISSLAAVAFGAGRSLGAERVLACLDARMNQVYWAAYECSDGGAIERAPEALSDPGDVTLPDGDDWALAGSGFKACPALASRLGSQPGRLAAGWLPHARDIALLAAGDFAAGRAVTAEQALPVYLRDDVVHRR